MITIPFSSFKSMRQGDYARWFTDAIKDADLAQVAKRVAQDRSLTPHESRKRIKEAIQNRYSPST